MNAMRTGVFGVRVAVRIASTHLPNVDRGCGYLTVFTPPKVFPFGSACRGAR